MGASCMEPDEWRADMKPSEYAENIETSRRICRTHNQRDAAVHDMRTVVTG